MSQPEPRPSPAFDWRLAAGVMLAAVTFAIAALLTVGLDGLWLVIGVLLVLTALLNLGSAYDGLAHASGSRASFGGLPMRRRGVAEQPPVGWG
jgi:hypothetical protein